MFGALGIEVVSDTGTFLEYNSEATEQLVDIAQSAFSKPGAPTREDVENHILPVSELTIGYVDGEIAGFSSVEVMEPFIYEVGICVREDYQCNGIGSALLSRSVLEKVEEDRTFGYRTQNPLMYSCSSKLFDVYPRPGVETPERMQRYIEELARRIDPGKELDGAVMKGAYADSYDGGMYTELPEGEVRDFMEGLGMNYGEGDALVIVGEICPDEVMEAYENSIDNMGYIFKMSS